MVTVVSHWIGTPLSWEKTMRVNLLHVGWSDAVKRAGLKHFMFFPLRASESSLYCVDNVYCCWKSSPR